MPKRRLAVIGHPLAAEENRLAFQGWRVHQVDLIVPRLWRARSLGHAYRAPAPSAGQSGIPALHVLPVIASGRNSFFLWMGLGALLARLKPDAIYCWEEPWCLATRQVAESARALGVPFAFYSAENRPKDLPWPFSALLRNAFAEARGCIVPTAASAERTRAWGYAGPLSVVPLWIRARKAAKADPGSRRIAYVGRLIPLKRVDLLLEALTFLPDFKLRIVGDGPERPRLESLARDRLLSGRVEFLGHVENAELDRALAGCSLLALPTGENERQAEQFGKAALEGVTLGLPVLASRGGNLADLAADFPTLAARDVDTPEDMAKAVRGIFAAYPDAGKLEAAKARAESGYGPAAAARSLEAAFSAMLGGRP